ncbi:MAG: His/Gly/Thr/Pro-type tRNA ligase C-terminal domain-containing protein, partial [Pirellulales bacterium]
AKIRDAQLELVPYMLIVGGREEEAGTVAVRDRIDGDLGPMPLEKALEKFRREVEARSIRQTANVTAGLSADKAEHTY